MSLRIAYMTGEYPRATDTFIQREVFALRDTGVHVQTLSIRKPHDKETVGPEQKSERANTHYVLPPKLGSLVRSHLSLLARSPSRYLKAIRTALFVRPAGIKALAYQLAYFAEAGVVARHLLDNSLTHLHNHFSNSSCSVAMLAAEMGGFTFSFTMHGPAEFFEPKYWRVDEKIRRALFVSCISNFCRSQAMIFAPQQKWNRLHIIHCGVDPRQFEQVSHSQRGQRLLFVGRLAGVKGVPILLDALAVVKKQIPDVRLRIAGDGPDRSSLEKQAQELGISANVEFLGYQSQQQVRELLAETDAFVMASFAEGVPVVLMEALAAGVPVVATQIAGIPELVEHGVNGYLVPPGSASALAERVVELMSDSDLRQRMGAAGRLKVANEFNIASEAKRLVTVLTNALSGQVASIRPTIDNDPSNPVVNSTDLNSGRLVLPEAVVTGRRAV